MTSTDSSPLRGALLSLAAFAAFATHDVFIKILGEAFSPFQTIFFATLMSFPLTTLMLMRDEAKANLRPVHPYWMALRTVCTVGATIFGFYAFSVLPLAQTYAILFAMPLLITMLAVPILGERVGWRRALAVLVGLAGVLVVLRPNNTDISFGHLAALACALLGALAGIIVRKIGREERTVVLILYPMLGNFFLMACLVPFFYVPMQVEDLGAAAMISVLGFAAGLCLIAAYRAAEAAIVAPMQYSQIVWAILFGFFLFDERIDLTTLLGASIIIASGLYIVFRESAGGQTRVSPVLNTRARGYGMSFRISPFLRKPNAK